MSQVITNVIAGLYRPYASEVLTVSSSAVPLSSSVYTLSGVRHSLDQVQYVLITSETADIRYTLDGITTPVGGSLGHLLLSGNSMVLAGYSAILNFRAIRNASTDATLQVTYER